MSEATDAVAEMKREAVRKAIDALKHLQVTDPETAYTLLEIWAPAGVSAVARDAVLDVFHHESKQVQW